MNKREYNKIANKNRKDINSDFISFLEQKELLNHFKNNTLFGYTFEEAISSGDPKLYFSLCYFDNARKAVGIIEEWKAFLVNKYGLVY